MIEPDAAGGVSQTLQVHSRHIRYGPFQVDQELQTVTGNGARLKVGGKPYQILLALIEKQGGVVTREELRVRLGLSESEKHVNTDAKVNAAVNKLRKVLRDSSDKSLYVETVLRMGYRLGVPSEVADNPIVAAPASSENSTGNPHSAEGYSFASKPDIWITIIVVSIITAGMLLGAAIVRLWVGHFAPASIIDPMIFCSIGGTQVILCILYMCTVY